MEAAKLSMAFVEAYDERDTETIRSLLDPAVTYVRPGPRPLQGVDAILAQYEEEWQTIDATIEVGRVIEADDSVAVELTLKSSDGKIEVGAVVIHRLVDDRTVEYRLYLDPVPG